jgi:hypothetical protein
MRREEQTHNTLVEIIDLALLGGLDAIGEQAKRRIVSVRLSGVDCP